MKHILPTEVINRPKMGFNFPLAIWLKNELKPLIDFVLSKHNILERKMFNYDTIENLKQNFLSGIDPNYRKIWGLIILELWLRLVVEKDQRFISQLDELINNQLKRI